jgi:hypothetical protein
MSDCLEFHDLINEHAERTGFEIPIMLETYLAELLSSRLEHNDHIQEPNINDYYLARGCCKNAALKHFADQCLFFTSFIPPEDSDTALDLARWTEQGRGAYHHYALRAQDERFHQLAVWFQPLQRFMFSLINHESGLGSGNIYTVNSKFII